MNNEQDIDKLFRRGLTDPVNEPGFREDDWDNLEQLLDGGKKRRGIVYWLPVISSVAAMLLLVLGWWLFKPEKSQTEQKPKQMAVTKQLKQQQKPAEPGIPNESNGAGGIPATRTDRSSTSIANAERKPDGPSVTQPEGKQHTYARNVVVKSGIEPNNKLNIEATDNSVNIIRTPDYSPTATSKPTDQLVAFSTGITANSNNAGNAFTNVKPASHEIDNSGYAKFLAVQRNKEDVVIKSGFKHPQFALSIMGAPEINGVNSFQSGKTGSSAGLLFSVSMNKLTISTGIGYAKKPYNTSFENYHSTGYTFKTYPANVIADCRAIDIPLNIDYQVFNKHKNKISVGTGVSSYLMMHENYSYEYADPAARGPRSYTIASPGRYLFGVLNLQATYQRQINSKIGVNVQPYLKLPLTNIGASQVRLQSAGVALGVSWNINSLTKP